MINTESLLKRMGARYYWGRMTIIGALLFIVSAPTGFLPGVALGFGLALIGVGEAECHSREAPPDGRRALGNLARGWTTVGIIFWVAGAFFALQGAAALVFSLWRTVLKQ